MDTTLKINNKMGEICIKWQIFIVCGVNNTVATKNKFLFACNVLSV